MISDRLVQIATLVSGFIALVAIAVAVLWREAARQDLEKRVQAIAAGNVPGGSQFLLGQLGFFSGLLRWIGERVHRGTRLYSQEDLAALEGLIQTSGLSPKRVLPLILGSKVILMFIMPLIVFGYGSAAQWALTSRIIAMAFAVPVGLLLPDWILSFPQRAYRNALRRGVSDALDLLVVCTEAGMGLESGLEQVSKEMRHSNRTLANALGRLLDDLKVLPDRQEALVNFGNRSGVEGIRRMATILSQTLQYGTPISQALRAVAAELRRDRMVRLEERAVRLPALLVFPLVVFILPSVFIVMGGVAFIRMLDLFSAMSK